jgi:hypothetical protein
MTLGHGTASEEQSTMNNPTADEDRLRAESMLADAQANPVLSGTQSCGVAQVYALLAIEQRLAHLCAQLDTALSALADRTDDCAVDAALVS